MTVTWVGHSTVLFEIDGFRVLTDPALTSRLVHLRRRTPVPTIAPVDVVLISHVHMDHLHLRSLKKVSDSARLVVPAGAERLVATVDSASITRVTAGQQIILRPATNHCPAIEIEVVDADHLAGRGPHSKVTATPVGFIVRHGELAIYFAGDTDLFDEMHDFGPIDLALIPIWGWGPTLGERHLDPVSAATATDWIRPRHVVPIHWGTYSPVRVRRSDPAWLNDALPAFRNALAAVGLEDRLVAVNPGGSVQLS
ncbi:MAG: MBL fold metallo-hydrolase [Ilumatobacteraceae bacterium]